MVEHKKYKIESGPDGLAYVIVRCPEGHLNRAQKVSDVTGEKTLVCANVQCKKGWSQVVPRIGGLEEHEPC